MAEMSLKEISEINKRMRSVLKESRHLYRVSFNAMFASRQIDVGIDGFVEVTSLLRDFSARLDLQVKKLATVVTESIYCIATLSKLKNMLRLINKAFEMAKQRYKTLTIETETKRLANDADTYIRKITSEVNRSIMLIGVGENLAILSKVEASSVPEDVNNLDTITTDMELIISNINKQIIESRQYIST